LRGTFLAVGDTHFSIDEKTMSVPPHDKECPPPSGFAVPENRLTRWSIRQ